MRWPNGSERHLGRDVVPVALWWPLLVPSCSVGALTAAVAFARGAPARSTGSVSPSSRHCQPSRDLGARLRSSDLILKGLPVRTDDNPRSPLGAPDAQRDRVFLTPRQLVERWRRVVTLKTLANWRSTRRGPAFVKVDQSRSGGPCRRAGGVLYDLRDVRAFEWANRQGGGIPQGSPGVSPRPRPPAAAARDEGR